MSETISRESVSISPPDTVTDEENGALENVANVRKYIEVKCGSLAAKMHVELFLCPGIHQPCIEFEKEMITPKEFTVRANKDKQKDWKGSIRIGKSNLRSLMEMHSFDFFNHSHFCSAKCQSRNYITPKSRDSEKGRRRSSSSQVETTPAQISELLNSRLFASTGCRLDAGTISQLVELNSVLGNKNCSTLRPSTSPTRTTTASYYNNNNNNNNTLSLFSLSSLTSTAQDCTEEYVDVDGSVDVKPGVESATAKPHVEPPTTEQILRLMITEPISFWNEMNKFGLLDQLVDQLLVCLSNVKCAAKTGGLAWAAPALTRVVSVLNMGDQLVNSIHSKPFVELQSNVSNKARLSMDTVYDGARKRSVDESSQSSQSRCSPDVKRPRVQYPSSMMTALDMDPRVLQALAQAQLRLTHETGRAFMQSIAPLSIPVTLPTQSFD